MSRSDFKSNSPDLIDDNSVTPLYDFDNSIYHAKEEGEEDCDLLELARHRGGQKVKVGAALEANVESRRVSLLKEYVDTFAWSYQDMPGLDTNTVVHRLPLREDCPPVKQKPVLEKDENGENVCGLPGCEQSWPEGWFPVTSRWCVGG
ncbi:hypothetical protein KIW84_036231 [Lathyrus oleraceus]|uniref:Uncharacterized protein n=1 Tax=Pisum sativum TaxID=3888 RepID=A0A9D4Y5W1_PEA|nr:hypothetical protein KIW84_036231 [Pisum sativum]